MTGPVPYFEVADIQNTYQSLLDAGAQAVQDVQDVGEGKLIAYVRDPDNNMIGLMHTPRAQRPR
jgi:predicted enzyme related to lactoylglutathione lyase